MHDLRNYLYSLKDEQFDEDPAQNPNPDFKQTENENENDISISQSQAHLDQSYNYILFKIAYLYHLDLIFNYD